MNASQEDLKTIIRNILFALLVIYLIFAFFLRQNPNSFPGFLHNFEITLITLLFIGLIIYSFPSLVSSNKRKSTQKNFTFTSLSNPFIRANIKKIKTHLRFNLKMPNVFQNLTLPSFPHIHLGILGFFKKLRVPILPHIKTNFRFPKSLTPNRILFIVALLLVFHYFPPLLQNIQIPTMPNIKIDLSPLMPLTLIVAPILFILFLLKNWSYKKLAVLPLLLLIATPLAFYLNQLQLAEALAQLALFIFFASTLLAFVQQPAVAVQ